MAFLFIVFVAVWGVAIVTWLVISRSFQKADVNRVKERILNAPVENDRKGRGANAPAQLIASEDTTGKMVLRLMQKYQLSARLQDLLEQAGLKWRPARVVHACLALFLLGFFVARSFTPKVLVQIGVAFAAASLPVLHIRRKRARRIRAFEEQFPESLEFVARSMRAGHAFSVSLEMLYREFAEPLSGEFKRTFEEHNLGLPLEQALLKLARRIPSLDVHFFVSAVLLQKRTGGNLAEILDKLANLIRERFKLRGKIRAISAHGRMTGMALTMIPLGVAFLLFWVNPGYVTFFLVDETGNMMAGAAVALQIIGYMVIRKIVSIEV